MARQILIITFCLAFVPCTLHAQPPALSLGLDQDQVIGLWGPPKEKKELEAKRDIVWVYPQGKIVFHDGKIISWFSEGSTPTMISASNGNANAAGGANPVDSAALGNYQAKRAISQKVLDEILEEIPSDDSASGGKFPGGIGPAGPGMPGFNVNDPTH